MAAQYIKDPDSVLDYQFYWADKIAATNVAGDNGWLQGDTITSSAMTVEAGLNLDSDSNDTLSGTAWISGGTVGNVYTVTNRIVTAAGRTADRSICIRIVER